MVLQSPIKLQVLVSAVKQDARQLTAKMNLCTDTVIVNQCDKYGYEEFSFSRRKTSDSENVSRVQCFSMAEKGVGLSRNTALLHADADICLFSDEDIVLSENYADCIKEAYEKYTDADMLLFNVKVAPSRRTYWNEEFRQIHWYNYGRYPAYSISGRLEALRRANVHFSLLFGGGARYSNGEDSLFLRDCLKAGLKIYAVPLCIGEEVERESTWFHGYTEKFFEDRGVLYHYLYGKMAKPFGLRFLWKNRNEMCQEISFGQAYRLLRKGICSQRK